MGKANQAINVDKYNLLVSLRHIKNSDLTKNAIFIVAVICIVLIAVLYWFFGTELGCSLRATGCNPNMSRAQGINTDLCKVLGLMISNGLVGLSSALLAQYQVTCAGDTGEIETYDVREFFRIRYVQGEIYLLDYNRKMEQIFDANQKVLDQNGILLGIASSDILYETNSSGNIVSFVRNGNLWTYNVKQNELAQVFSFSNIEGNDARSRCDQHNIRIISVEKEWKYCVCSLWVYESRST